tara:strand:+ start:47819 stop:50374 length:2556 start_codon:yes stop_codon:yes gene_type:complete
MKKTKFISGSSTVFVIVFAAAVMTTSVYIFNNAIINQKQNSQNVDKIKATYEAEGFIKGMVNLTKQFVSQTDTITTDNLTAYIEPHIVSLTPAGYTVGSWSSTISVDSAVKDLPSGPFAGMQSDTRVVNLKVALISSTTGYETSAELDGVIAGINFTQFGVFSFYDWAATTIVNKILINGRVFANRYIYIGSSVGNIANANQGTEFVAANYFTSAGYVMTAPPFWGNTLRSYIAADDSGTNFVELKNSAGSGCTNCDGTGLAWKEYALARWNGRVQDSYHGVPAIHIKTADTPRVQRGRQGANLRERLMIDPIVTADPTSVRQAKFAYKADIRIINGVWYLKNPANENDWPGIPVWSDHPGSFRTWDEETTEGTRDVGQTDITNYMTTHFPQHAWPTNTTPQKFSYYEYDTVAAKIKDNTEGVISYGNLAGLTGSAIPGGYASNNLSAGTQSGFCYDTLSTTNTMCTNCSSGAIQDKIVGIDTPVTCSLGSDSDVSHRIVNATRSGYRFGLWQQHSPQPTEARVARSKVYPMNFDLNRFQDALGCTHDPSNPLPGQDHRGELGCYFKSWGMMGRAFNGIIFISGTWAGSLNGLKDLNTPVAPPYAHTDLDSRFYGSSADANQTPVYNAAQSQALPMQLCSTSLAGGNLDAHGAFKIPNCDQYKNLNQADQIRMRTTALRLINGANISTTVLPKGLSVITNLHVYLQGDLNTSSSTTSATSTPWSPLMVAGDDVIYFSNNWRDHNARWDVATGSLTRNASSTTYNVALMKYWPQLLLNESWGGRTITINGPQILPHYSIYPEIIEAYSIGDSTWTTPSTETYRYDPHFQYIMNQPPGVPFISVFATSGWKTK